MRTTDVSAACLEYTSAAPRSPRYLAPRPVSLGAAPRRVCVPIAINTGSRTTSWTDPVVASCVPQQHGDRTLSLPLRVTFRHRTYTDGRICAVNNFYGMIISVRSRTVKSRGCKTAHLVMYRTVKLRKPKIRKPAVLNVRAHSCTIFSIEFLNERAHLTNGGPLSYVWIRSW